ncbi:2,3-dihydro-2,3-dihydroxybenzoate dehydrogenase [Luedemannella helvata]|uniref:2,3-dihydro-2,3-dihydroxybenzoate dehydrogenase n=1 Tax=Luedemannella helvata TaxID=349315 RepID=A0ABP4VZX4_9ACTN
MSDRLDGRVAIVTGAARGIGAAVAARLAELGAVVVAADRDAAGVSRMVEHLRAGGDRAYAYPLDVRDTAAVEATVSTVELDIGPIAILVNAAGILRTGPLTALTDADWAELVDTNAGGVLRMSRAVAGPMRSRRHGCILTVGSNAAGVPRADMAAYAAAKAAATHLTRCLGLELARDGVRCNVVAPGSTNTAMLRSMLTEEYGLDDVIGGSPDRFKLGIPLGRLAQPGDIADAVAFLASDRARHITMQQLYVDGGASLQP